MQIEPAEVVHGVGVILRRRQIEPVQRHPRLRLLQAEDAQFVLCFGIAPVGLDQACSVTHLSQAFGLTLPDQPSGIGVLIQPDAQQRS